MLETPSQTTLDKESVTESLITIRARTATEELEYFEWMLSNKNLLKQYNPTIPNHDAFSTAWQTGSYEPTILHAAMKDLYDPQQYALGLELLTSNQEIIQNHILPTFREWQQLWRAGSTFKIYPHYEILLTQYGSGGSYHPESGRIVMLVRPDGTFKRTHPLHTIVHEMVHLGIQDSIVKAFGLSHSEKEHLVDRICVLAFGTILVDYQEQKIGDTTIGKFITTESLSDLPAAIQKYVESKQTRDSGSSPE